MSNAVAKTISTVLALAVILTARTFGQVSLPEESIGGPLSSAPVPGAPFSADATTSVHAVLRDGTRLDRTTTDRYYRDSAGRVRIERHMEGLPAAKTVRERHIRTVIAPDPRNWGGVYTVDDQSATIGLLPRSLIANTAGGNLDFSVPVGGVRFVGFFRAGDLLSADPGTFGDVRDESSAQSVSELSRQPDAASPSSSRQAIVTTTSGAKWWWWTSAGNQPNFNC